MYNDVKKGIKTRHLLFLVLTISLVLSSVAVSNDMRDYGGATPYSAEFKGTKGVSIEIIETQLITTGWFDITSPYDPFSITYQNWDSVYFDVEVTNITNNRIENMTIQSKEALVHGISMYGCNYSHTDAGNSYTYKPQELGTNFNLKNPSDISYVYLNLGFNIYTEGSNNVEETRYMINNATVDIRIDDEISPGAPVDENIVSIPLNESVVVWDAYEGSTYVGDTIGNAMSGSNPTNGMLADVIIQVPVNVSLQPGDYWTVLNSKTYHEPIDTSLTNLFKIDVFLYNDGSDDSVFVNRTYDNNFYTTDIFNGLNNVLFDVYHIIEKNDTDYTDPADINFEINNHPVNSSKTVRINSVISDSLTFNYDSNQGADLTFSANISAIVRRDVTEIPATSFEVLGDSVLWNSTISAIANMLDNGVSKNTTLVFPTGWDASTLDLKNSTGSAIIYNAFKNNATIQYPEYHTGLIDFQIHSRNIISNMSELGITATTTLLNITVKFVGTNLGPYLNLDLYCNGTFVQHAISNVKLNQSHIMEFTGLPGGTGYTVRAFWDNGSDIGYCESVPIDNIPNTFVDDDPDVPGGDSGGDPDGNEPNTDTNRTSEFKIPQEAVFGIVAVISALGLFKVIKKGRKKIPKLSKVDSFMPDEHKDDDWF